MALCVASLYTLKDRLRKFGTQLERSDSKGERYVPEHHDAYAIDRQGEGTVLHSARLGTEQRKVEETWDSWVSMAGWAQSRAAYLAR
jgi:hypothetical protein